MLKKIILVILSLGLVFSLFSDPINQDDIAAFNIKNLKSNSFDKRMKVYRIIKNQKWQKKYKKVVVKAILKQLHSQNVRQQRTGVQGAVLMNYNNKNIDNAIIMAGKNSSYKRKPQYFYLQQSIIEYLSFMLEKAKGL